MRGCVAVIRYDGPIAAPIEEGQTLGAAVFILPSGEEVERPLVAGASVPALGGVARVGAALRYLVFGPEAVLSGAPPGAEGDSAGTGASGGG